MSGGEQVSWQQAGGQGTPGAEHGQTPAAWYPDPSDPNLQRYWDGEQWTGRTTPSGTGHGQPGATPAAAAVPPGGDEKRSVGMFVGIGAGSAILVVLLVIIGVNLFGSDGGGQEPPPTMATEDPESDTGTGDGEGEPGLGSEDDSDEGPVETDDFVPGDLISGTVPEGGEWTGTMTLTEESAVILDARREGQDTDLDVVLTLFDDSGAEVSQEDERPYQLEFLTGGALDPYIAVTLEPGVYTVAVGSFLDQAEGPFVLETATLPGIEPEQSDEFLPEAGQYGGFSLHISEPGTYTLTTSVTRGIASVVLFDDAEILEWNRGNSATTELVVELEPGIYPVLVAEANSSATTITFAVEANEPE